MDLEFRIFKAKEDSKFWEYTKKFDDNNQFIIVGEEKLGELDTYKACQINKDGKLFFLADLKIDEFTMNISKDLIQTTNTTMIFDVPKERVSLDIIEKINYYNSDEFYKSINREV